MKTNSLACGNIALLVIILLAVFSAGVTIDAEDPDGAKALIQFLKSPVAAVAISESGLEPVVVPDSKTLRK
jgi:hypothetical protein